MPITGESLFNECKNLLFTDSNLTYYDVINGGAAQGKTITFLNIINQDTINHTVTLSFNRYAGSYGIVFEKAYTISPGQNEVAVDFIIPLLAGANPDKIQVKIADHVSSGKKITINAVGIDFS